MSRLPARQSTPHPTRHSMSARSDLQNTLDQQPDDQHRDGQDESTIARYSSTILCGTGPRATNLVPTPPNKQPKSSCIWRHRKAVTDLKNDLNKWLYRLCYEKSSQSLVVCLPREPTNQPIRHLMRCHGLIRQVWRPAYAEAPA